MYFPPTLTMMHLCITQCTYWTPLPWPYLVSIRPYYFPRLHKRQLLHWRISAVIFLLVFYISVSARSVSKPTRPKTYVLETFGANSKNLSHCTASFPLIYNQLQLCNIRSTLNLHVGYFCLMSLVYTFSYQILSVSNSFFSSSLHYPGCFMS